MRLSSRPLKTPLRSTVPLRHEPALYCGRSGHLPETESCLNSMSRWTKLLGDRA